MLPNNFTLKSQEALQNANAVAIEYGQQAMEPMHLLAALLAQDDGVVMALINKIAPDVLELKMRIEESLELLPKARIHQGGTAQIFLGQETVTALGVATRFQGSKHVPEDTYFRDLERVGASDVNGSTADDRTNYHETVPKNRLDLALWLESDRMGFLLDHVDQQTFAGQRDVVKNERRQNYENSPYGMVSQFLAEALFPPLHPYHHLAIGSPADLDAATLEDVKQFFRTWYVPNNATLVIAGDIDPDAAMKAVEKYFGPIPSGKLPARLDQNPPPRVELAGETRLEIEAGVELPRVVIGWISPAYFAEGDADLDLVARVLASGKTSRLYKRLVYDDQIAQDVSAFQASEQLASKFEIVATAKPGHTPEELLAGIDQEIQKLQNPVGDAELGRARTAFLSHEAFGLEGVGERADTINSFVHYTGDAAYLPKDIARYEAATPKSLADATRRWLPLDKRVVAITRPVKGAPLSGRLIKRTP